MSIEQEREWITGEEFNRERRRLIEARVPDDDPRFAELIRRITERDDYLFEEYGKQHMATDYGKWIAVSLDGSVMIRDTASELTCAAREAFGGGNFSKRRLAEFPGHVLF